MKETKKFWYQVFETFPLQVLATGSGQANPSARPTINMSLNSMAISPNTEPEPNIEVKSKPNTILYRLVLNIDYHLNSLTSVLHTC